MDALAPEISVEILVSKDESADDLVTSSFETLVVKEASAVDLAAVSVDKSAAKSPIAAVKAPSLTVSTDSTNETISENWSKLTLEPSKITSILEASAEISVANEPSAANLVDSSFETLVVNELSAANLVDSSFETLVLIDVLAVAKSVATDASPESLEEASVATALLLSTISEEMSVDKVPKLAATVLPPYAISAATIPTGSENVPPVIIGLFIIKSDCKSKTILVCDIN